MLPEGASSMSSSGSIVCRSGVDTLIVVVEYPENEDRQVYRGLRTRYSLVERRDRVARSRPL